MPVVNLIQSLDMKAFNFGTQYKGSEKEIAKDFGAKNLGFHLETLDPKTFSCPYHYHEKEEELCYVVEGEAMLRENGKFRKIVAGDLVYFGTGPESAHHIYNFTEKPFKFLALSTKVTDELCHYPDSKKVLNKKTRVITQNGEKVDYWKDEEDPSQYWPSAALNGNASV